jgi:formiminoglutamate deiminase
MNVGTRYHCELAWLGGDRPAADVLVEVVDGRIASVSTEAPASPDAVRLAGLTLPGLANAHSHAFHRALRGRTHAGSGSFWTWRDQMYALAEALDPDGYHALARAVFAEMALAGVTCVGEFHYLHHGRGGVPYTDPNEMGAALIAAAAAAGVRITLLDTCYLRGGHGTALHPVQRRFADADADAWAERTAAADSLTGDGARLGAAVHSVRALDARSIARVASVAAERRQVLHAHVSEQPAENDQCLAEHGATPVGLLARLGVLGPSFTAVHATHLTTDDIARLGRAGCCTCACPTTERDLADGVGPFAELVAAGSRLSLGSDSHAVIDLFDEARAVELDARLVTRHRGNHGAATLLAAATTDGHHSLGWSDAGRIEVGARADLVSIRLDSVRLAGTRAADAVPAVVFAATAADVHHVVADGRAIVSGGAHRTIDVARELHEAIDALDRRVAAGERP